MYKKGFYILVFIALVLSACSGKRYGHYNYVKKDVIKVGAIKHNSMVRLNIPCIGPTTEISEPPSPTVIPAPILKNIRVVKSQAEGITATAAGRSDDVTKTNKESKKALVSAVGALGSVIIGLFFAKLFLAIGVLLAIAAFMYSIIALRKIRKTGEYGKRKVDVALLISLPILFVTLGFIIALLFWHSGGFQLGIL